MTSSDLVKVYSHPRSGTHFLEAFLANNFYKGSDLSLSPITWGHWSNRIVKEEGNPLGLLFGSHHFPKEKQDYSPGIYIYRDGRSVALSCWKTPNFKPEDMADISFSEYLRTPIDWSGTPSNRNEAPDKTIAEHWLAHVEAWNKRDDVLMIRYEDIIASPEAVAQKIATEFGLDMPETVDPIKNPTGLLPNTANKNEWENNFSESDLEYFFSLVDKDHWALQ